MSTISALNLRKPTRLPNISTPYINFSQKANSLQNIVSCGLEICIWQQSSFGLQTHKINDNQMRIVQMRGKVYSYHVCSLRRSWLESYFSLDCIYLFVIKFTRCTALNYPKEKNSANAWHSLFLSCLKKFLKVTSLPNYLFITPWNDTCISTCFKDICPFTSNPESVWIFLSHWWNKEESIAFLYCQKEP